MSRRISIFIVALFGLTAVSPLAQQPQQQQQPPATALILGRVVDAGSGRPLSGAIVTISPGRPISGSGPTPASLVRMDAVTGPTRVMTDDEGRFLFHGLPGGSFSITAMKSGYMSGAYGRRIPGLGASAPLSIASGEQKSNITVSLWKHGVIGGRVVDEQGEPMIGVQVRVLKRTFVAGQLRLSQTGNMPVTDDRGIYRISTLEPGEYVAAVVWTQSTTAASVMEVYASAMRSGDGLATMRMLDAAGGTLVRDGVRIGDLVLSQGRSAPGTGQRSPLPGIAPPGGGRVLVYPTVYYPVAATPSDATVIPIGAGEERLNIDFQLRPVPSIGVSGILTGPDGPMAHTGLDLVAAGLDALARDMSFEAATAITDATGAFTFLGVTPGQYTLRVQRVPDRPAPTPGSSSMATIIQTGTSTISSGGGVTRPPERISDEPTLWASMPLAVGNSDISGISVTLRTGARVSGRVQFDGSTKPPAADRLETMTVMIESSDGRTTGAVTSLQARTARVDTEGRLNSYQLPPGSYILRAIPPTGWTFASAMRDGRDVSVEPLDVSDADVTDVVIRFTDRPSELAGTVSTDAAATNDELTVVVFPVDARGWTNYGPTPRRLPSTNQDGSGPFVFTGLPDGEYYVAAIRQDAVREWRDPAFLKKLAPLATRVKVAEGQKATAALRVVDVR